MSWDDENGNIKRSKEEVQQIFKNILKNKKWIIEDVGRDKFSEGRTFADVIYYIKFPRIKSYYRVTKRWIRQKRGKERYNAKPNFKQWLYYISTVNSYYKKEKSRLKSLEEYKEKLVFIKNKDIKNILK